MCEFTKILGVKVMTSVLTMKMKGEKQVEGNVVGNGTLPNSRER